MQQAGAPHDGAQQLGAAQVGQQLSGAQHDGAHSAGAQQDGSTQHSQQAGSQQLLRRPHSFLHHPNRPQRFFGASQHSTGQQQQSGAGAQHEGAQQDGGAQQLGSQHGAPQDGAQSQVGAQHDGAQHVGAGSHFFLQQPNRPALAVLMLAKSTTAAVRVVNFILRSPDLFRVTVEDDRDGPAWVADRSLQVPHTLDAWVHLRIHFGVLWTRSGFRLPSIGGSGRSSRHANRLARL